MGDKNRYKVKVKFQTVYKKLKNEIKYLIQSISNDSDIIVTKSLKINEMVQNKQLSKKIYGTSWYELIKQLEYKTK